MLSDRLGNQSAGKCIENVSAVWVCLSKCAFDGKSIPSNRTQHSGIKMMHRNIAIDYSARQEIHFLILSSWSTPLQLEKCQV